MAGLTGLEPATFRVTGERSNQLSYNPIIFGKAKEIKNLSLKRIDFHSFASYASQMNGSLDWTRTSDLLINSQLLYQLSYQGTIFKVDWPYYALTSLRLRKIAS